MKGKIILKRGKDKPLVNHHPWIFSGAIDRVLEADDGDTVDVLDSTEEWLARGAFNSRSQIAVRVWTFANDEQVNREYFRRRLAASINRRNEAVIGSPRSALARGFRLVNAESDGLPGLIVDRYGDFLVAQFLTLGSESHKKQIAEVLQDLERPQGIYERSDVDVRKKEGLAPCKGVLSGNEPPDRIEIIEDGLRFYVDVRDGHKTGFYLDQRQNRRRAAPYMVGDVLNAFAYTGSFGVYAARQGASSILNLDTSAGSLRMAAENFALNGLTSRSEILVGDAFEQLRKFRDEGRLFDGIVLDPPKFVSSRGQMERGLRGYKDLNMLAFQLLRPGGTIVTFSCSGLVSSGLFQQVVFGALRDADREAQIVEKMAQAPDHPISLTFPEGEYLKGLIVRVL